MISFADTLGAQEAKVGGLQEFKASLGYAVKSYLKKNKTNDNEIISGCYDTESVKPRPCDTE